MYNVIAYPVWENQEYVQDMNENHKWMVNLSQESFEEIKEKRPQAILLGSSETYAGAIDIEEKRNVRFNEKTGSFIWD